MADVDELVEVPFDATQAVTVAYVHGGNDDVVAYSWHHSMIELVGWDMANHGRILQGGYISMRSGTNGLVESRNNAIRDFLLEGKADWLFWIDTDMGFPPDIIDQLMAVADPHERPIVGALCFSLRADEPDGLGGWRTMAVPTIFDWAHVDERHGFAVRWDYPINTVTACAGTGSAAILIHRRVFEAIADKLGPIWYNRVVNPSTDQLVSEDLSFCMRAGALHFPIYVHTGVQTTHSKQVWVGQDHYWRERAVNPPPPPTESMKSPGPDTATDPWPSLSTPETDARRSNTVGVDSDGV